MPDDSGRDAVSRGFPPVVGRSPRVLILGSLPGQASLAAGRYYAQPHNAFWPIMGALCGADPALTYAQRLAALKRAGIALWDVLHAAARPGSLDSSIVAATVEVNSIAELLDARRSVGLVAFNGQTAAKFFARHVALYLTRGDLELVTLPSTSPAHASLRFPAKLARWRAVLEPRLRKV